MWTDRDTDMTNPLVFFAILRKLIKRYCFCNKTSVILLQLLFEMFTFSASTILPQKLNLFSPFFRS